MKWAENSMHRYTDYLETLNKNYIKALRGEYDGEHPSMDDKREFLKSQVPNLDFMVDLFEEEKVLSEYRIIIARQKAGREAHE